MDRTNWIRYILTATDRASRQVLASDAAIRKSVKDTQTAASSSAATQSSSFARTAGDAESSSKRVVRSLEGQKKASKDAREELRKFGFEQTAAWKAGSAFDNHLRNTNLHLTRLRQSIRNLAVPALVAAFTTMAQAASTAAGGAISLIGALEPLGGLLDTLPGGVIGLAQAFGTLFGAISPVKQAVSDYMAMWKSAATQEQTSATKMFSASKAIKTAQNSIHDATLETAEANRTLKSSQEDVERAQVEMNKAIAEGKREMVDLKNAAVDASLSQRSAGLSLRQAVSELRKTEIDPGSTMLEVEQAQVAVSQARQGAKEATLAAKRAQTETEKAKTGGVDKMPNVIAAHRSLTDAEKAEADAARGVTKANVGLERALEGIKNAHKQAGMAAGHQASQLTNLKYDMAQLSPAGKQFAQFMAKFIQGPLATLEKTSQTTFLPKLEVGIRKAAGVMPLLQKAMGRTGDVLGHLAEQAGQLIGSKGFGSQLSKVMGNNSKVMGILGHAAIKVAGGMVQVAVAARPLMTWLAKLVSGWAETWAVTKKAERQNGTLTKGFEETKHVIKALVDIASNLWHGLNNILHLSKPLGDSMFASFDKASKSFRSWTESAKGKTSIEKFFAAIKPALYEAGKLIKAIVSDFAKMGETSGLAPLLRQVRLELLPAIMEVSEGFSASFGPGLVEMMTAALHLFDSLGHPLTTMLAVTAKMVDGFASIVQNVPGMRQLLSIIVGISIASRAISFVAAITGLKSLVDRVRDVRAAAKVAGGKVSGLSLTEALAAPGESMAKPLYVYVVNEVAGIGGSTTTAVEDAAAAENPNQMSLIPAEGKTATSATTTAVEDAAGAAGSTGMLGRAGGAVKSALPGAGELAGAAGIAGVGVMASQVGGSVVGGSAGSAISNIGSGAALGAAIGSVVPVLGTAVGAGIGAAIAALITFRKQVKEGLEWIVEFTKKHSLLVAAALAPLTGGFSLIVLAIVKWHTQIEAVLGAAFAWMVDAANDIVDFFSKLPGRVVSGIKALPGLMWSVFKDLPNLLGKFVGFFLTLPFRIAIAFTRLELKVGSMLIAFGPKLLKWGLKAMEFLVKSYVEGVKDFIQFWIKLPGRVINAITSLGPKLFHFGVHMIGQLLGGMKNADGGMLHFVMSLPGRIAEAITKLAPKIFNAGKEFAAEFAKGIYEELPGPIRDAIEWTSGAVGTATGAIGGVLGGGPSNNNNPGPEEQHRNKKSFENSPFGASNSFLPKGLGSRETGPDPSEGAHKKTRKNWEDTANQIGKSADSIKHKVRSSFEDQAKSSGDGSEQVRKHVANKFGEANSAGRRNLTALSKATSSSFASMTGSSKAGSSALEGAVLASMGSAASVTYQGMNYIAKTTNAGLKAFDAKPTVLQILQPKIGAKSKEGGGWIGSPGERGPDDQLVMMGRGEAVLNFHHQNIVEPALRHTYGFGLDDMFGSMTTPHTMAFGSGGFTGTIADAIPRFAGGGKNHNQNQNGGAGAQSRYNAIFNEANTIDSKHYPYLWGGGHGGDFQSGPYDCSGAISRATQAGYPWMHTTTSGPMMNWFKPGRSSKYTIRASPEHTYGVIGGRAWGTSTTNPGGGAGWIDAYTYDNGMSMVDRHPGDLSGVVTNAADLLKKFKIGGPNVPDRRIVNAALNGVVRAYDKNMAGPVGRGGGGQPLRDVPKPLQPYNHNYPSHTLSSLGGHTRFSESLTERIMRFSGLPGKTFAQIAHGESDFYPGIFGIDPGGTVGRGLLQVTSGVGNDAMISKYGGTQRMFNPLVNSAVGKQIYKGAGDSISPWYGTKYVTGAARGGKPRGKTSTRGGRVRPRRKAPPAMAAGLRNKQLREGDMTRGEVLKANAKRFVEMVFKQTFPGRPMPGVGFPNRAYPSAATTTASRNMNFPTWQLPYMNWNADRSGTAAFVRSGVVHESAHTQQTAATWNNDRLAEGGAERFRILKAPSVLMGLSVPYDVSKDSDSYPSDVSYVIRNKSKAWALNGQFKPPGYAKLGFARGGRRPGGRRLPRFARGGPRSVPWNFKNTAQARMENRSYGTAAHSAPFRQYGFNAVPNFGWEKFKKDPAWQKSEKSMKEALAALAQIPTDHFKKWVGELKKMEFVELGQVLKSLSANVKEQAEKLKKLVHESTSKSGAGGKKVTKAESKQIEEAKSALHTSRAKAKLAASIRKPLVKFNESLKGLTVGQLNPQQAQLEGQISGIEKGGVSKKERPKLARAKGMLQGVKDAVGKQLREMSKAAEEAVSQAAFGKGMAELGKTHLEIAQKATGYGNSPQAMRERSEFTRNQTIPALKAEEDALNKQLAVARNTAGPAGQQMAREVAQQIAGVQNSILEAAQQAIEEQMQAVLKAAENAVELAGYTHNMAETGLTHLELEQKLSGGDETIQGKEARAAYIKSQIIPALQAEESALKQELHAAQEEGGEEGEKLARQIAEQIAGVQNGILEEQVAAQELTKGAVEDLNDTITGSLGFSFNSQQFTDVLALGVGT